MRAGDRVAIAMRNLPEFVVGFWGAALNGAIVVPLNSWWTGPELNYALRDAGASVAYLDDERLARVLADGRPAEVRSSPCVPTSRQRALPTRGSTIWWTVRRSTSRRSRASNPTTR